MGMIEDISRMQSEGRSDFEIRSALRQKGVSDSEIEGAMSQVAIKGAVGNNYGLPEQQNLQQLPDPYSQGQVPQQGYEDMQPSLMSQEMPYQGGEYPSNEQYQPQPDYQGGFGGGYENYPQYQGYQDAMSSDVISEIAEQVVTDKISMLNEKFEEAVGFKSVAESKLRNIEERIERIEKIFDKLQLSILQRVAEYVDDVKTIKKEMQETQKSFKALHGHKEKRDENKRKYVE